MSEDQDAMYRQHTKNMSDSQENPYGNRSQSITA